MTICSEQTLMFQEAASASSVISRQLMNNAEILEAIQASVGPSRPSAILTCARGSSDHAATYLRYVLESLTGVLTSSISPSVSSLYSQRPHVENSICVTISQSGRSEDLLSVVEGMNKVGVRTVALVNDAESPLAQMAQFTLPLLAGPERSVAATKSFIGSLFASLQLANCLYSRLIADSDLQMLPQLLQRAWLLDWSPLIDCLVDARGMYVIGRGISLSVAGEAALKLKETCNLHAEAYSAAEVRHGPMALFDKEFPVLIFRHNDASSQSVDELAAMAAKQGCRVFVVGGDLPGVTNLESISAPVLLEPLVQIQSFYRAVNELSIRRGRDPDNPPLLKKVTVTV